MIPEKFGREKWMKLIGEFMAEHNQPIWTWDDVLKYEGGYGSDKIHSIEEALLEKNRDTLPGIWFQSDQKNLTEYGKYSYVYSALFGQGISAPSFGAMRNHFPFINVFDAYPALKEPYHTTIIDFGGTIFTSINMLKYFNSPDLSVRIMNIESPQTQFARYVIDRWKLDNLSVHKEEQFPVNGGRTVVVFSEVLEHLHSPEETVKRALDSSIKEFYVANSFTTPSYGHYCPIKIGGKFYSKVRDANKAFLGEMSNLGLSVEKVEGFNSRLMYMRPYLV